MNIRRSLRLSIVFIPPECQQNNPSQGKNVENIMVMSSRLRVHLMLFTDVSN